MLKKQINWGIIGLGKVAHRLASDLHLSENAVLYGVASRDIEKARDFSQKYNAVKYFNSYEELAKNPEIDVIYIATPHTFHFENTMMCFKYGKSVLCEKPMGVDSKEVQIMIKEARSKNLFLMEGIWTRFIPAIEKFIGILEQKVIGDVNFIRADFGYKAKFNPESRIYNKNLGGGSLLDIGIYPIYLSMLVLGLPVNIKALARMTETNVDSYCAMLFDYENSAKAILESTTEADTPIEAYIYGSKGYIKLHKSFHHTEKVSINRYGEKEEIMQLKYAGQGFLYEIDEVNQCIFNNKIESKKLPHSLSIDLIHLIDLVKDSIGLSYNSSV